MMSSLISHTLISSSRKYIFLNKPVYQVPMKALIYGFENFSTTPQRSSDKDVKDMCGTISRGIVLGVFNNPEDPKDVGVFTTSAYQYNMEKTKNRLFELLTMSGSVPKKGECRLFFDVEKVDVKTYSAVALVGLGRECRGYDQYETIDEGKENIRRAAGAGVMALQALRTANIDVEDLGHAESAAEGAALGIWVYQELKNKKHHHMIPNIDLFAFDGSKCDLEGWKIGIQKAAAQNLTRQLQETPANLLTPTTFAQTAVEVLCKSGVNVEVKVSGWAETQQMNAFLAVSRASCETPIFLELSYYGTNHDEKPVVLIGQGVTYDAGGICLKKYKELKNMRGDMTGAAVVVATCKAIAALKLPINIRGLIPLCENVLGCNAFKPGDVYKALNGKSVEVERTDYEDVLVLIDALLYAQNFCPKFIVDVGTTTKDLRTAFDEAATGVFTNSEYLWKQIKHASAHTGCRVWRLPLWDYYSRQVTCSPSVDVQNVGCGRGGMPCKLAAFLREFVPCGQWMHIDASNVMKTNGLDFNYLRKGMAGRPTRTLIEFLAQIICYDSRPKA